MVSNTDQKTKTDVVTTNKDATTESSKRTRKTSSEKKLELLHLLQEKKAKLQEQLKEVSSEIKKAENAYAVAKLIEDPATKQKFLDEAKTLLKKEA